MVTPVIVTIDSDQIGGTNQQTVQNRLRNAVASNNAFLALGPSPTNAQVIAQVIALTKQVNGLVKLLHGALGDLSDISGT